MSFGSFLKQVLFPYGPFLVLAAAAAIAVYHVNVYW